MIRTLFFFIQFVLLSLTVSFAQEKGISQPNKIVFINKSVFDDNKIGIKKLSLAYDALFKVNCYPLNSFEILKIQKELETLNFSPEEREKKENYLKTLQSEQDEESQKQWERREKILIEPILEEISALIKEVEIQNNITILDLAELHMTGQILATNDKFDISSQFAAYFNNKTQNPNEILKLNIPDNKIAVINTEIFYDAQTGINNIIKIKNKNSNPQDICSDTQICIEIGKSMASFAKRADYSFIFDSSKNLPVEISGYRFMDVTQEFISEYNKSNK